MTVSVDTDLVFESGSGGAAGTPTPVLSAVDPTSVDDADDGYAIGQPWVNTVSHTWFVLTLATAGAAVWQQAGSGGTGDMLKATYDPDADGVFALAQGGTGATSAAGVRTALSLGTAALVNTGTGAGNAILGNDARLTDARTPTDGTVTNAKLAVGAVTDDKASLATKPACTVVATTNQTLSGTPTIDSVSTAAGSLALCTAQTSGAENGPWVVAAGAWSRPAWYPSGGTTQAFAFITTLIRLGTVYQGSTWRMTTTGAITIDTTPTAWSATPLALGSMATIGANTMLGSIAGGPPAALSPSQIRTLIALVIGTNVQAWDADLDAIAALTSAANKMPYSTGAQAWSLADLTAFARTFLDDADGAAVRTTIAAAGNADVQIFTASGTWTKPAGAKRVHVEVIGAGGGGGTGRRGAAGTQCGGGGAGGPGTFNDWDFDASSLGATEAVTVGAAGGGHAANTVDDSDGATGTAGGFSLFGTSSPSIRANGGAAGGGGTAAAGGGGGAGGTMATYTTAAGGAGGASGTGTAASVSSKAPGGGGGGGGINTGNTASGGGTGGCGTPIRQGATSTNGGASDGVGGTAGGAGGNGTATAGLTGGGAGGGASATGAASGAGGDGAAPGGGGGGGGASRNTFNAAKGGDGGRGEVRVTTYF